MNPTNLISKISRATTVRLAAIIVAGCAGSPPNEEFTTWTHYGGSPNQSRYFEADQITRENVGKLEIAWMYPSGDNNTYYFNPLIVDTTMYVMGKNNSLIALNVETGKEIWIHANLRGLARRGINYWESEDKKDKRLIFTLNNTLQAIDAVTGKSIMSFGDNGYVDMREGLGREPLSVRRVQAMMPGVIYEDLVIVGSSPGEGFFSPPGYVRAYNVVTGEKEWTFHTIPLPGEYGYDTWPKDAYQYVGGVNVWSEMSVDSGRGIVYLPLGSPTYDFYGADRSGANLFGNSLVALDARTGERIWHFQTVHHDLWDYDLPTAPQLLTVNREGKSIDAVAVATKHGFVFVFDRETGEPIFPIEEKPFPPSEMPGEEAWPTQPIPSLPGFTRHEVTKETLNPYFPDSVKQQWYRRLEAARSGLFIPPSDQYETVVMPGALGGANFGNTAANPKKGILYILTQEYASIYKLNKVEPPAVNLSKSEMERVNMLYSTTCITCHGSNMEGGSAPRIKNAGQSLFFEEFKNIVLNGKGQMPGFTHVDEGTLTALYRYLGGNPKMVNFFGRVRAQETMPEGPVVASGGVLIKEGEPNASLSDYPDSVAHPAERYTSDYGTEWMALSLPPWSSIVAYDLNNGTIKWKKPIGQDSLYVRGDQSKGAPNGTQRKGLIITSTGVVFATAKGGKLYAYDADNGDILWETTMSHESDAQPSMYTLNGKQYLVINATSNFKSDSYDHSRKPDASPKGYVVYALPGKE